MPKRTGKAGRNKHGGKASETTNKRSAFDPPVIEPDEVMVRIDTRIDQDADEDEYDDGDDLKTREPVL